MKKDNTTKKAIKQAINGATVNLSQESLAQFPRIISELKKEAEKRIADAFHWIDENESRMNYYLTSARQKQFNEGRITRAEAIVHAKNGAVRDCLKTLKKDYTRLNSASAVPVAEWFNISIEWKPNRIWGMNPSVTVRTARGIYTGSASGCGYDKRTAAIANACNDAPELKKILYISEEKRLGKKAKKERREALGYGCGYGALPYYEGGVGIDSYFNLFNLQKYEFIQTGEGRYYDCYSGRAKK